MSVRTVYLGKCLYSVVLREVLACLLVLYCLYIVSSAMQPFPSVLPLNLMENCDMFLLIVNMQDQGLRVRIGMV